MGVANETLLTKTGCQLVDYSLLTLSVGCLILEIFGIYLISLVYPVLERYIYF